VTQNETKAALYIDEAEPTRSKALFDALLAQKVVVEAAFGGPLNWVRADDKRASWITVKVPGGWVDESTWPHAIEQAVDAMNRLHAVLAPRLQELKSKP
jgi:hypothetical protein